MKYKAVVMGTSAGGLQVLSRIFAELPADYALPIIVVQHRSKDERTLLEEVLSQKCSLKIRQAEEKEKIYSGNVYFAPPDYHLLIENDFTFSLSCDPKVNYSRPSIDVLFETAAWVFRNSLLAILLTGANHDGAKGMKSVKQYGGTTIAQDPKTAHFPAMPRTAIDQGCVDLTFNVDEIIRFLKTTVKHESDGEK